MQKDKNKIKRVSDEYIFEYPGKGEKCHLQGEGEKVWFLDRYIDPCLKAKVVKNLGFIKTYNIDFHLIIILNK
jgi:hypothetical protein